MKLFSAIKEGSKRLKSSIRDAAHSPEKDKPMVMEWDKIYVEIDNDALSSVAKQSPTQRRRNIGLSESNTMYDGSKISTFDSRVLSTFEGESTCYSPTSTVRNIDSATTDDSKTTFTRNQSTDSRTFLTRNPSSESESEAKDRRRTLDIEMPDENSRAAASTITKGEKLMTNTSNHIANAQLMRWKTASEEGPCLIHTLVFFSAIAAIFTTLFPLVVAEDHWTISSGICAFHTTILCLLIITFEIRICGARNPMGLRAKARKFLVRHLNLLGLLWGRGLLYIFAGSMNLTMVYFPYNVITGGILIALGIVTIMLGAHAAYNLERLRLSLTDPSFLWNKFVRADSNNDNLLDIDDFSELIWSLGLELDDSYTFRAFSEIDRDRDGLINFYEFKYWWISSQEDDGTIVTMDMSKLTMDFGSMGSYSRKVPEQISTDSGNGSEKRGAC